MTLRKITRKTQERIPKGIGNEFKVISFTVEKWKRELLQHYDNEHTRVAPLAVAARPKTTKQQSECPRQHTTQLRIHT